METKRRTLRFTEARWEAIERAAAELAARGEIPKPSRQGAIDHALNALFDRLNMTDAPRDNTQAHGDASRIGGMRYDGVNGWVKDD